MKRLLKVFALSLTLIMTLTACDGGKDKPKDSTDGNQGTESVSTRSDKVEHKGEAIKGGVMKVGLVMDSPFKGVFSDVFAQDAYDQRIFGNTIYGTFDSNDDFSLKSSDAVDFSYDVDAKTVTIVNKDNFKWSDGTPVTAKDWEFHYKIVAHPEYTGKVYDGRYMNVVGIEEYHDGKTEDISGITMPDEKTIVIEFKEFKPGILWGGGVAYDPLPYEYLKDVPVKDMETCEQIREKPLSVGPFVVSNLVPGEKVEFVRNEHYYGGEVKLDGVEFQVVPSSSALAAMKAGKYDLFLALPTDLKIDDLEKATGYTLLERDERSYTYIGFKLGKWDKEKEEVVVDSNAKMADPNLRKAMGYALDNNAIGQEFYQGLRSQARSIITPVHKEFFNEDAKGYNYDPEKAKKLLDEAGYKDIDNDGFREDPKGEKLVINFASMSGGEVAEPLAQAYIQWWKDIGLNVELVNGRLIEFQAFYDMVRADDPKIDVFQAAWSTGTDPDPNQSYGRNALNNYSRYINDDIEKAMNDIGSVKSVDEGFRKEAYKAFDEAMFEAASTIPTLSRRELLPVNNRIKDFDWSWPENFRWADIELTADKPVK